MGLYGVFVLINSFFPPSWVQVEGVTAYLLIIFFSQRPRGTCEKAAWADIYPVNYDKLSFDITFNIYPRTRFREDVT